MPTNISETSLCSWKAPSRLGNVGNPPPAKNIRPANRKGGRKTLLDWLGRLALVSTIGLVELCFCFFFDDDDSTPAASLVSFQPNKSLKINIWSSRRRSGALLRQIDHLAQHVAEIRPWRNLAQLAQHFHHWEVFPDKAKCLIFTPARFVCSLTTRWHHPPVSPPPRFCLSK
ncbi:unnamed protein product [Ixodes hexagonus]